MKTFTYTITDPEGIHARPAGLLVSEAKKYQSAIMLDKDGKQADAKKIFGVMGLGAKQGAVLTVSVDGADEDSAAAALEGFLKANL